MVNKLKNCKIKLCKNSIRFWEFTLFAILLVFQACKEEYKPNIDNAQKFLVVDGILTDETNIVTVKLSTTVPFQEKENDPVVGAIVYVVDDKDRKFTFTEKPLGTYKSTDFKYEYGRTYILNIETNKNKYKSSPQKLYPKVLMESVTTVIKTEMLQTAENGIVETKSYQGLEFDTKIKPGTENSGHFRFSNAVIVEYIEKINWLHNFDSIPGFFYCWKRYYPNESFVLNDSELNSLSEYQQTLAFCPIDTNYFTIIQKEVGVPVVLYFIVRDFYYFIISVKQYQINQDVHQYYKAINVQLEAKNRIFDPISFQVRGNIYSVTDPDEPVLGVFEVASVNMRSYSFSDFQVDRTIKFDEIDTLDIDALPYRGSLYDQYPSFWIFNYRK